MITILTKHRYYTILYVDIYIISYRYTVTYTYIQNAYNYNLPTLGHLVAISNIKHINEQYKIHTSPVDAGASSMEGGRIAPLLLPRHVVKGD